MKKKIQARVLNFIQHFFPNSSEFKNFRALRKGLKQSVISEIRSYGSPPDGVHQVMMATYILLGQRSRDVQVRQKIDAVFFGYTPKRPEKTNKQKIISPLVD